MPRVFDEAKAQRAVAEAQVIGYEAAAKKYRITVRQLYRWRGKVGGGGRRVPAGKSPKRPKAASTARSVILAALVAQQKRLKLAMKSERDTGVPSSQTQAILREVERLQAELAALDARSVESVPIDVVGGGGDWLSDLRSLLGAGMRKAMSLIQTETDVDKLTKSMERLGGIAVAAEALGLGECDPGSGPGRSPAPTESEGPAGKDGEGGG